MLRTTGVLFKRKVIFLLFLIFFCFMTIPVFAEEAEEKAKEKQKEAESEKIVVLRAGEWEIDAGG
ncbi:MAG: hypothetical protein ACXWM6_01785, partial [Thermodesulfobacteriota bacterium]